MVVAQSLSLVLAQPGWWRLELGVAAGWAVVLLLAGGLVRGDVEEEKESSHEEAGEATALLRDQGESSMLITVIIGETCGRPLIQQNISRISA